MSDSEDLFGESDDDGGDTDELIRNSTAKPIAKKKPGKSRLKKAKSKSSIPDADNDSDNDGGGGLIDSDAEDSPASSKKPALSKREKMEALRAKRRAASGMDDGSRSKKRSRNEDDRSASKSAGGDEKDDKGYDSGDSYNSGEFVRTQADEDFIDRDGDDEDAIREYEREQNFDDERPDGEDEEMVQPNKKKRSASTKKGRGPDALSEADKQDMSNPVIAAVNRMKVKKKEKMKFEELREIALAFLQKMEQAADDDDAAIREKRPGMKKLRMLPDVMAMLANREMTRPMLEVDVLVSIKRWIQPMKNGQLGNLTIRRSLIETVANMSREDGIDTDDLKRSDFGKLVMTLFMHKKETPEMKKQLNSLIQQWSRIVFKKSGDMKDLARGESIVRRRRENHLTAISRAYEEPAEVQKPDASASRNGDIGTVISKGVKQARDLGKNRVRIPFSKGFQYTVRPSDVQGDVTDKRTRITQVKDSRESLHKAMLKKNRKAVQK